jgi:hypothetical protein
MASILPQMFIFFFTLMGSLFMMLKPDDIKNENNVFLGTTSLEFTIWDALKLKQILELAPMRGPATYSNLPIRVR